MDYTDRQRAIMAILFAAGECVGAERMAQAIGCETGCVHEETKQLMDQLNFDRCGIRIVRLEDGYQMCSAAEMAEFVTRALETRKPPKLSASQLEALTVVAYYQPVTKAYVEQIRGVDSSYSLSALLNKKLIEECGRLAVPGRPILYRTTPVFLRTFGLESLEELPPIDLVPLEVNSEKLILHEEDQMALEELQSQEAAT